MSSDSPYSHVRGSIKPTDRAVWQCSANLHRHIYVLAGDKAWQKALLISILQGVESEVLWLTDEDVNKCTASIETLPFKKAKSWLGNEKKVVIYDANKNFEPDSFAAISGIIVGGGVLFLLMPETNRWNTVYPLAFGQRLLKRITESPEIIVINETDGFINVPERKQIINNPVARLGLYKSVDQQQAVEIIERQLTEQTNTPVVLVSDRGRGKSAALGLSVVKLIEQGIKHIIISAPRLAATDIIFKHIKDNLPQAEMSRGSVRYAGCVVQFYPPDELLTKDISADILLVDEAAAIPVPMLTAFLNKYPQCVFATTVHGYEGTGRGFAVCFYKVLDKLKPQWIKLDLHTPIRWPENDPLEKWIFELLCLDAEYANLQRDDFNLQTLQHRKLGKDRLAENNQLIKEVFALLVLAHYRTRPRDLKSLLDDDNISVYASFYKEHVVAVSLVIAEGKFSKALSTEVYRGKRRPTGNLLAQTLTYHCGVEHAATLNYARIMRIAVHPNLQLNGIGSALLKFVLVNEKQNGRDIIGTSFGMNMDLPGFWVKQKFKLIRIGFTREQTSGEHAAVMLLAFTEEGEKVYKDALESFNGNLAYWLNDVLSDIDSPLKDRIEAAHVMPTNMAVRDKKDIESFIEYSRNYELCIGSLNRLVVSNMELLSANKFPEKFRDVLLDKVINRKNWKDISETMHLSGKSEARKLFQQAIRYLLKSN